MNYLRRSNGLGSLNMEKLQSMTIAGHKNVYAASYHISGYVVIP